MLKQCWVAPTGATGPSVFLLALNKAAWIDGICAVPTSKLSSEPAVQATELYPDIKFQTLEDFYRANK